MSRHLRGLLLSVMGLLLLAAASIAFALRVTPSQSVSALGQTVDVGAANPTLSASGPGVLDLFGQSLPTKVRFVGPVRPRLVLTRITINQQVENFAGLSGRTADEGLLGKSLANGWTRYFIWEIVFVALGVLVLTTAYSGLRRLNLKQSLMTLGVALVVVEGINLGFVMNTAYSAPSILAKVHSLSELVGQSQQPPIATAPGPKLSGVQAIVLGDSTAAGLGNPPVTPASPLDKACGRSSDAYATDLARVNSWNVENLSCSGATVTAGLLGPQSLGGNLTAQAQLSVAKRYVNLKAIFVSVGADDLDWAAMVKLCALSKTCDDSASTAYFQSKLNQFTKNYYALLAQLRLLRGHPQIVVNQYYDPFDPKLHCLSRFGLTAAKQGILVQRLDALNAVLRTGATASGFESVKPDFSGHELCTSQPYVQGLNDAAPFHPTASGELAIALTDEQILRSKS